MSNQFDTSMLPGGSAPQVSETQQSPVQTPPVNPPQTDMPKYDTSMLPGAAPQSTQGTVLKTMSNIPGPAGNVASVLSDPIGSLKSAFKGIYHGMDIYATTVDKAIAKGLGQKDVQTALQSSYDEDTKQYNQDVNTNAHPVLAGLGNFGGQMIATAPLMAIGPEAAGASLGGAVADLGGNAAAQTLARGVGTVGQNVATAALQGGLMTNPGQDPNTVFNTQNAQSMGKFGALLSLPQAVIGSGLNAAKNYENFANNLSQAGYKGPVFSTDVPQNQGMWNSLKQSVTNSLLSKIPYISDIPGIGVNSARQAQQQGIQDALGSYVSGLAQKYPNGTQSTLQKAIQNSQDLAKQTIADTSNTFRQILKDNGVTNHDMIQTAPLAESLKQLTPPGTLKQYVLPILDQLQGKVPTSALLGTAQSPGIKQQIWAEAQRLGKLGRMNTAANDAHDGLLNLYHSINNDINTSIQNVPEAQEAFHTFNTTTKALSDTWDVKNSPEIAKAAMSLKTNYNAMNTFYNKMVNGSIAPQQLQKYSGMIGSEGMDAITAQQAQNMFNKNLTNGKLNITNFFNDLNNPASGSVNQAIRQPIKDSLQGLQYLAQKNQAGLNSGLSDANKVAGAGLVAGAGYLSKPITGAILGSATALGAITAHPPLMNLLKTLNKLPGMQPGMSQYLFKKANDQLIKAGIIMKQINDQNGQPQTHFETTQDQ